MKIGKTFVRGILLILASLILASATWAAEPTDEDAIRQAVLNYVNSIYEVKPDLLDESVSPKVQKVGYAPKKDGSAYREMWMTFDDLRELTQFWNQDGHLDAATAKREIRILDRLDQIATVRLDAEWGIDYIQLAKAGDKWMIMSVIWQTYPVE